MLLLRVSVEPVELFLSEPARLSLFFQPFLQNSEYSLMHYATWTAQFGQATLVTMSIEDLQGDLQSEKLKLTDRQPQPRQSLLGSIEGHALHQDTLQAPLDSLPPK